jgi:prepilin-type N-terminal cleavage/methylation domain-containing protein
MNSKPLRRPVGGFTLIELLIVVAIIAILAAIAVPNFLEAQTRSKVSRARADLRSAATALESYYVDINHYPTMLEPGFSHIYGINPYKWWYIPNSLSTPVAYITNANLICPFGGDLPQKNNFPDEIWRRYSYENVEELHQGWLDGYTILAGKYSDAARPLDRIGRWRVLCIGPDNAWNPMVQYDPTNGTVSKGNIMRSQAHPVGMGGEQ